MDGNNPEASVDYILKVCTCILQEISNKVTGNDILHL